MQKVNTSHFISNIAPVLEEQNIFIQAINFETFENENKLRIIIEGIKNETENQTNQ